MEFINPEILEYSEKHSDPESELLKKLNRETHSDVLSPRMLSGHMQGRILSMLSKMLNPDQILEIGTYTGYSALCLAEGLKENGQLHTIDNNEIIAEISSRYFSQSIYSKNIISYLGSGSDIIPQLDKTFDLVFIDADKSNYSNYYDLVFNKVRPGGIIIADNVLWSGKVLDKKELEKDKDTIAINSFNEKILNDERVEKVLFPVRDGLLVIRKKG